jgi:hypothetical protein
MQSYLVEAEENHKTLSVYPVSGAKFETGKK